MLTKVCIVKAMVFPVVIYGCGRLSASRKRCFQTVVLEKTFESPLDFKEIKPVNSKGIFIGRTIAEAEAPIL